MAFNVAIPRRFYICGSQGSGKSSLYNALYRELVPNWENNLDQGKLPSSALVQRTIPVDPVQQQVYNNHLQLGIGMPNPAELSFYLHDDNMATPHFITSADVLIVTFALDDRDSLKDVRHNLVPTLRLSTGAPIILVGTKADLRNHEESDIIPDETIKNVKYHLQARHTTEVDASNKESVGALLDLAISTVVGVPALGPKKRTKAENMQNCCVM